MALPMHSSPNSSVSSSSAPPFSISDASSGIPVQNVAKSASKSVGGPWADFISRSDASMAKLLQDSLPKTKATRASWLSNHQDVDDADGVDGIELVDIYTIAVATILLPAVVITYVIIAVAALPSLLAVKLYAITLKRPTKSVDRGVGFHVVAVLVWILALPCTVGTVCYWVVLFPIILVVSLLYSVASLKILLLRDNLALMHSCSRWPKWSWRDTVCAVLGTMDRQGFARLATKLPTAVVVAPILKYLFGCNPLLYRLAIRQRCLWTSPVDFDDQKAVAAVVQAASWTIVNLTDLLPQQVSKPPRKDDRIVSGHIPFPAEDRVSGTVIGTLTTNSLVTFVNADHNVNGSIFHSMTAKRSIYNILLYVWNPCHYLTGYVEINLQHEGGIEQAMWCIVGDNYLGNLLFERTDALFWHYDPIKRGIMAPSSVRFIRGSVATTASATDSVVALDGSNSIDARRTLNEPSHDSYDTGESFDSYETELSLGSCDTDGSLNDYSNRVTVGAPSDGYPSTGEAARNTLDSVAMLQSESSSASFSEFNVSDRSPYVV